MDRLILIPVILPLAGGMLLLAVSFREHLRGDFQKGRPGADALRKKGRNKQNHKGTLGKFISGRNLLWGYTAVLLTISVLAVIRLLCLEDRRIELFALIEDIPICFRTDALGKWFAAVTGMVWLAAGIFSYSYMKKEGEEKRYLGFYLMLYGVLTGLDFSGNLVTMYLFYELTTLLSMPLVMHSGSRESLMAGLKYLLYSLCGAYGGLWGIFFLNRYCDSLTFSPGGTLNTAAVQGQEGILLAAVFVMLLGFGAKAGMLPLHGWLPAAHPVAPSPASAVLSSIIVKAGVLAIIRSVYYVLGPAFLRGTWVQYGWMILTLLTVFMGSLLACRQKILKKRLAYSTVSQVSYILLGLSLLTPAGMEGALLHTAVHAVIKCGLFLAAGVYLQQWGFADAEDLRGAGRREPKLMWCVTILSLGLIGIPPGGGFVSKWYLAEGALESGTGIFTWLAPAVLLASALLTAAYLLPIVTKGFFPGGEESRQRETEGDLGKKEKTEWVLLLPVVLMTVLSLLAGAFPGPLTEYVSDIVRQTMP